MSPGRDASAAGRPAAPDPSEAVGIAAVPKGGGRSAMATGAAVLMPEALDALMPMHVLLAADGRVLRHGPMLARLSWLRRGAAADAAAPLRAVDEAEPAAECDPIDPAGSLVGASLFDVLAFRRPRGLCDVGALREAAGAPLHMVLVADSKTRLSGVAAPLPGGGLLLNLSFGLGVMEAVSRYRLTAADFAPTDLAVEMLYLVEANTAVLAESRDLVARLQGARDAAETEAQTDTLTGLRNRRALDGVLDGLLQQGTPFALMALDLDRFKQVNDTHGHAAGDAVLRVASKVMLGSVRASDVVARAGGDEFVILFPGLVREARLAQVAQAIIEGLERPIDVGAATVSVSSSIGVVTTASRDAPTAERLSADADAALYASKRAGRSRATIWSRTSCGKTAMPPRVTVEALPEAPEPEG